jgi:hypothetical protein
VDVDDLYRAKNPAWVDWDLCEQCVREIDAKFEAEEEKRKQAAKKNVNFELDLAGRG